MSNAPYFKAPGSRSPSGQQTKSENSASQPPPLTSSLRLILTKHVMQYVAPWNKDPGFYLSWTAIEFDSKANYERFIAEKESTGRIALCPTFKLLNTIFIPEEAFHTAKGCFLNQPDWRTTYKETAVYYIFHLSPEMRKALGKPGSGSKPGWGWYKATSVEKRTSHQFSAMFASVQNVERIIREGLVK